VSGTAGPGAVVARHQAEPRPPELAGVAQISLEAMREADLDAVVAVESGSYGFPWTRGHFADSLAAGHDARVLRLVRRGARHTELAGHLVAMPAAGEVHLLNVTVAPAWRGRGLGRHLLRALVHGARRAGATSVWLEVRAGNARAQALYARLGFAAVGRRPRYYPAGGGTREDAVLMCLPLEEGPAGDDALV
jgi:ribosomal-protein-alanine N-acetyltransferase